MNKSFLVFIFTSLLFIFITGCTARGEYTCGVPNNGVRCQPMDETHRQLYDGSLNSLHIDPFPEIDESSDDDNDAPSVGDNDSPFFNTANSQASASMPARLDLPSIMTVESKQAILSQPREMRIWFDRFTDPDGDLHDESFVFIRLDNGHWIIDNKPVLF